MRCYLRPLLALRSPSHALLGQPVLIWQSDFSSLKRHSFVDGIGESVVVDSASLINVWLRSPLASSVLWWEYTGGALASHLGAEWLTLRSTQHLDCARRGITLGQCCTHGGLLPE